MIRLREMQEFDSPDLAEAARLMKVLAPAAPSQALANRLYAKIYSRRVAHVPLVNAVVFGSVVLVSTVILSATLVRQWLPSPAKAPSVPTLTPPRLPPPISPDPAPVPAAATLETEPAAPVVAPVASPSPTRASSSAASKRRVAIATARPARTVASESVASTEARAAAAPPEEAALVLSALRALRREHSPARSGILIDYYLSSFPRGVLIEEALAVGIEAAVTRADPASTSRLATRYLDQYPNGRFAKLAHKAASGNTP